MNDKKTYKVEAASADTITLQLASDVKKKIAIDPGHGDKNDDNMQIDPGAVNGKDYEKDIVLKISNSVKTKLEEKGYEVIITRTGDKDNAGKKILWRIDAAKGTDILVSIHSNSFTNAKSKGFAVCYKSSSSEGKKLAQAIQDKNTQFFSKGIMAKTDLKLLNKFDGISVLVEAGFISNTEDLAIMKDKSEKIGEEIALGILAYLEVK